MVRPLPRRHCRQTEQAIESISPIPGLLRKVRIGDEVIDGNVDSLDENPTVPKAVRVAPYWGPITRTPSDRKLHEYHGMALVPDHDVETIWWPDLQQWIDRHLLGRQ